MTSIFPKTSFITQTSQQGEQQQFLNFIVNKIKPNQNFNQPQSCQKNLFKQFKLVNENNQQPVNNNRISIFPQLSHQKLHTPIQKEENLNLILSENNSDNIFEDNQQTPNQKYNKIKFIDSPTNFSQDSFGVHRKLNFEEDTQTSNQSSKLTQEQEPLITKKQKLSQQHSLDVPKQQSQQQSSLKQKKLSDFLSPVSPKYRQNIIQKQFTQLSSQAAKSQPYSPISVASTICDQSPPTKKDYSELNNSNRKTIRRFYGKLIKQVHKYKEVENNYLSSFKLVEQKREHDLYLFANTDDSDEKIQMKINICKNMLNTLGSDTYSWTSLGVSGETKKELLENNKEYMVQYFIESKQFGERLLDGRKNGMM